MNAGRGNRTGTRRKPEHAHVVRMNISLPPGIVLEGKKLILSGGYQGWSDYIASKVRRDARLDPEDRIAA